MEATRLGGVKNKRQFPQKVMAWIAVCSEEVLPLVMFNEGTVNHARYIDGVLPGTMKYGNGNLNDESTFQQDGTKPHVYN